MCISNMEEEIKKILQIVTSQQYTIDEILSTVTNLKLKPKHETDEEKFERKLVAVERKAEQKRSAKL